MEWFSPEDLSTKVTEEALPKIVRDLLLASTRDVKEFKDFKIPISNLSGTFGFDGILEVPEDFKHRYIPAGKSVFEMGANKYSKGKAEDDYIKRFSKGQKDTTYIIVTPNVFNGADDWRKEKIEEDNFPWKDVKCIEKTRLYEWFQLCPEIATKWAEEWGLKHKDVYTIKSVWEEWDYAFNKEIPLELIQCLGTTKTEHGKQSDSERIIDFINSHDKKVLIIASSSVDESRVYLASILLLHETMEEEPLQNKVLCLDTKEGFKYILEHLKHNDFSPVIITPLQDASLKNKALAKGMKVIQVLRRTNTNQEPDISLPLRIKSSLFRQILQEKKFDQEKSEQLVLKSGRNLTCLRNVMGDEPPKWLNGKSIIPSLLAALLVGGWSSESEDDMEVMRQLSKKNIYDEFTSELQEIIISDNPPLQHEAPYYRSISSFSSWPVIEHYLTPEFRQEYKDICLLILGKTDKIEVLPAAKHTFAAIEGVKNSFSPLLRSSLANSLIHLSFSKAPTVDDIVFQICSGDVDHWKSISPFLSELAEASPESFLRALRKSYENNKQDFKLLVNEQFNYFEPHGAYISILHALELIAWNKEYLEEVSELLIKLSICWDNIPINICNTPLNSFSQIFCTWDPQTTADTATRNTILSFLSKEYPDNLWPVLLELIPDPHYSSNSQTSRPKWKWDVEVPTLYDSDIFDATEQVFKICIDLVINDADRQIKILKLIAGEGCAPDWKDMFYRQLEEKINNQVFKNTFFLWDTIREIISDIEIYDRSSLKDDLPILEKIYDMLAPEDIIEAYAHYFYDERSIVGYPGTDRYGKEFASFIKDKQKEIINGIYKKDKKDGLLRLLTISSNQESSSHTNNSLSAGESILGCLISNGATQTDLDDFILNCFETNIKQFYIKGMVQRYIELHETTMLTETFEHVFALNNKDFTVFYLGQLPILEEQLCLIDSKEENKQNLFWKYVNIYYFQDANDKKYIIRKFLEFDQPERALMFLNFYSRDENNYCLLYSVLYDLLPRLNEKNIGNESYFIKDLFQRIALSPDKNLLDLARLEWNYFPLLDGKAIALYEAMAEEPDLFLYFISLCFYSKNEPKDERTEKHPDDARKAYKLLSASILNHGPLLKAFKKKNDVLDVEQLEEWFTTLQKKAKEQGYEEVAYSLLGGHLAYSDKDPSDNIWPEVAVRNILNIKEVSDLRRAYIIGYMNRHGSWGGSSVNHFRKLKIQVQENRELIPRENKYITEMFDGLLKHIDSNIERASESEIHDDMGAT